MNHNSAQNSAGYESNSFAPHPITTSNKTQKFVISPVCNLKPSFRSLKDNFEEVVNK